MSVVLVALIILVALGARVEYEDMQESQLQASIQSQLVTVFVFVFMWDISLRMLQSITTNRVRQFNHQLFTFRSDNLKWTKAV